MKIFAVFRTKAPSNRTKSLLPSSPLIYSILSIALPFNFAMADTQTIQLLPGVNLISFTVQPTNPSPSAVFGTLGNGFVEASTFDNQTKIWTTFRNPSLSDATTSNVLPGLTMPPVSPGRGYSVRMSAAATLTVNGTTPAAPSVTLYPGLNFVGFPLPSTAPSVVGVEDILNGPQYRFERLFQWSSPAYASFTNNGISDDSVFLFEKQRAYWVESTSSSNQIWTPQVAQPPLVYVDRGNAMVVEAPIPESVTPLTANVPVRLTRTFVGTFGFLVTGTAHPNTDFSISSISPTNSVGNVAVNAVASTYSIPVSILQKPRIQTNASVFITLRRPVETPKVADSGTLPQVAHIKITDGMNGIYEGFMEGSSATTTLNGQNFRIALRSNGQAIFDPGDGGLISSRFTLPYTLSGDVPQFSGSATVSLATSAALGRTVTVLITPAQTVSLDATPSSVPSFEVPLNLNFSNLTGSGSFQTTSKITLTQADPAL